METFCRCWLIDPALLHWEPFSKGARSPDLRQELQSTLTGSFTIERELDGAGMSRLFVARELSLGREVVIKVLHSDLDEFVKAERFRREIQLAARLQTPT